MSNQIIAEASIDVNEAPRQAENAQNTADKAASGVTNLNDPNLMSVIEKQYSIAQFAGLTSQYNVIIQNAKDDGIDTTALTTAYNSLNQFMANVLADPGHASDVDRATYKQHQDAYNAELANLQNALQNNANNKFASATNATSQAASTASQAFSAAGSAYNYANSEITIQSAATAKAQSKADSAFSQAKTAIDTGQAASEAVTALKDGSTLTIAELGTGLASKVASSEYASYKTQTASQVAQMVTSGAFSAYQQTTAELISEKVATSAFSAYQETTAKAISSKVETSDFNTYKTQTADAISAKVATKDFSTYTTQTANDIDLRVEKKGLIDEINLQVGNTLISSSGQLTLSGKNIYFDTANPVIIPSANIDKLLVDKKLTAADISANTFSTNNGTFTVDKNGAITAKNMTLIGGTLDFGFNGTFTESYDYTQDTSWFLPKKATGSVVFEHGVIEDQGTMQSYVNGVWGGKNDSNVFTSGLTNNVWTEYAPGYYKIDMYKQGSTSNVLQRTYADPTGYYYTDAAGDKSYLGNVLQTPQVQTGSLFSTTLNQMPGDLRMRVVANGSKWGLQVGSYAGKEAVLSDFIYDFTSSQSSNVFITANGHLSRSTSASKYKYNIKHALNEDGLADKLLTMHISTWNDKHAVDSYAQTLTDNTASEDISIKDNYGLIAEDLRDAGLDMFIEYGKNHTIEGIEYDRAWLPLLPKMRQMNDKINEYELRISKLEAKINE